jgi:hypothetical protein
MSLPQYLPELVAVGVGITVAIPFHRALRRTSPKASLLANLAAIGLLVAAAIIVLVR